MVQSDLSAWNFRGRIGCAYFVSSTLVGTDFTDAVITGASFNNSTAGGLTPEQLYSTASYKSKDLGVPRFRKRP